MIGVVIDEVILRFEVDEERIKVLYAGRYLTRDMNLEQARGQKQCTLNVLIKKATDAQYASGGEDDNNSSAP